MKTVCTLAIHAVLVINIGFIIVFFTCLLGGIPEPRWHYVFWRRVGRWWQANGAAIIHRTLLLLGLICFFLLFWWLDDNGLNNVRR